jgi:hypothetical protein
VTQDLVLRVLALCIALASAETLHGIARTVYVVPRIGKERAIKLSALTGSLLAFLICLAMVPGIALQGHAQHAVLGLVLAGFMACFDIAIGRFVMRKSWAKIRPDFDPRTGNYLLFGLLALALAPMVVFWLRGGG